MHYHLLHFFRRLSSVAISRGLEQGLRWDSSTVSLASVTIDDDWSDLEKICFTYTLSCVVMERTRKCRFLNHLPQHFRASILAKFWQILHE